MPKEVPESSGLAVASEETFWTHNDRGGRPLIFEVDMRGELVRSVELDGADHIDYEDMTQDNDGNLYVGDFGNNKKDRDVLTIYKVPVQKIKVEADGSEDGKRFYVQVERIDFLLPFSDTDAECHYDMEAMVWNDGRLTIFTKDRCDKTNNVMHFYSIPDIPGKYTAAHDGFFNWGDHEKVIRITGADLSLDGRSLVLLSKDAIHLFYGYRKSKWFQGTYRYIPMEETKKEGVCHMTNCDLYISEESKKGIPGKLIKLNLCQVDFD